MSLRFRIEKIEDAEFGIGVLRGSTPLYGVVAVGRDVQASLRQSLEATWQTMNCAGESPSNFDPAEKYASKEYLVLPIADSLGTHLRQLHEIDNLASVSDFRGRAKESYCYFARFVDGDDQRVTAIRRSAQFKATLNAHHRLLSFLDESLRVVQEPLVQLNTEFDVLLDSGQIHILHPASFRALGRIEEAVKNAMSTNVALLREKIDFVNWESIERYAATHSRAANLVASIRSSGYAEGVDRDALIDFCSTVDIGLEEVAGRLIVPEGKEIEFLEVLDRRRYSSDLASDGIEHFKASSRRQVK